MRAALIEPFLYLVRFDEGVSSKNVLSKYGIRFVFLRNPSIERLKYFLILVYRLKWLILALRGFAPFIVIVLFSSLFCNDNGCLRHNKQFRNIRNLPVFDLTHIEEARYCLGAFGLRFC